MEICVLDLEATSLYANHGIILCAVIKPLGKKYKVVRADEFKTWRKHRSDNKAVVQKIMDELKQYDIIVAHNGNKYDKTFLTSACIKYGIEPILRYKKIIDPCLASRRHLRLQRNSLVQMIDYFGIKEKKTPIEWQDWLRAGLDGDSKSLDRIVTHCIQDVKSLEIVYKKVVPIIHKIDTDGSFR